MNKDFPRILSLLRKERGLTQKQAAQDLGVAQALLSHYEKGKRECGLDFLVRAADYYNVSTDYLLGRSPLSDGKLITESDIPETEISERANSEKGDLVLILKKKLITNSIDLIFSLLNRVRNHRLSDSISSMLMLSVYKSFRITYSANKKNEMDLFTVPEKTAGFTVNAAWLLDEAQAVDAADNEARQSDDMPQVTTGSIQNEYGQQGTALLNLIKNTEIRLNKINRN